MNEPLAAVDFEYELPEQLIAQRPLARRDESRLMVLDRATGEVSHRTFGDVLEYLEPGDVLVRNTSRVMPARLHGTRASGAPAEILLLTPLDADEHEWLCLGHPGGKLKPGRTVTFGPGAEIEILEMLGGGVRRVRWLGSVTARDAMHRYGEVPLPPYIHRPPEPDDAERYQTVYAEEEGSAAAPTAGLHFTGALLDRIRERGVHIADVDLHVGLGTFKPVECDRLADHVVHTETYTISQETAQAVNAARAGGHRVIAVGTTVVRALESSARALRDALSERSSGTRN